jgi:hypothetical protein
MWNIDLIQYNNIMKNTGHAKGKLHKRGGGQKKEVKKVKMCSLYKNEYRICKPVEDTIRRELR